MIHECATPGCATLTFGEICLGCEQKRAGVQRVFPRGRPAPRHAAAAAVAPLPPRGSAASDAGTDA
jgi:hypothetical protein